MKPKSMESGQALILIVFAIVGLVGVTALAVDGGMAYSDRRNAQNAADGAALAAALADVRGHDIVMVAKASALNGGFDDNKTTNTVNVTTVNLPTGACPNTTIGKDITVEITSHLKTSFGPVIGIRDLTNTVRATSRSCDPYIGPLFMGNAIVALAPTGIGFDAAGTPDWSVIGGGIFSNSAGSPSARCKGASDVAAPSLTAVGVVALKCAAAVPTTTSGAHPYQYSDYEKLLPPVPACDGNAKKIGQYWVAAPNAHGSRVAFNGDMQFGPGLFCVTNSPGPFHGEISGTGVTFYIMPTNFTMTFNGGGGLGAPGKPITAPTTGTYAGILIFSAPQLSGGVLQSNQSIDMRGNGNGDIEGSIIMPSANITMFGNSGSSGFRSQVIGYHVDSGGNANININYNAAKGYQVNYPAWITLLR